MANKIDSNISGLRFEEEASLGVLPGSPVWKALEPNSFGDFGGQITTVARTPINAGRMQKKGVVTDLDASAGYETDLTSANLIDFLPGFLFADWANKDTFGGSSEITNVDGTADEYDGTSIETGLAVGDLIFASEFTTAANNGLKEVSSVAGPDTVGVVESLTDEASPPAGATIQKVGLEAGSADLDVDAAGANPAITSTTLDFTTLGLAVGEWIFIGGDAASTFFVTAANNGFARIFSIATNRLEFDKTALTMVTETGTGLTIRLFFGSFLHNQIDPANQVRKTYQFERTLGEDGSGTMSEYVVGCVANELSLDFTTADKVTANVSFVGIDHETRDGVTGVKSGSRPTLVCVDGFNSSSDVGRLRVEKIDGTGIANFLTDFSLTISNSVEPTKAIGTLGAIDTSAGDIVIGGSITAYFSDVATIEAVRANDSSSVDAIVVVNNAGLIFDVPLCTFGDGRVNVTKDDEMTIPLTPQGAQHTTLDYVVGTMHFPYLPNLAG